jgi:hypothetical protein
MRCAPFFKQALYFAETDRQKAAVSRCFQEKARQAQGGRLYSTLRLSELRTGRTSQHCRKRAAEAAEKCSF